MHLWQRLRQVGVAFVGHDHGRARLGDQQIGAGDADIGGKKFLPQHRARLGDEIGGAAKRAVCG
jgi:hypothetical protein